MLIVPFQMGALFYTQGQDWFVPFNYSNPDYSGTTAEDIFKESSIELKEEDNFACWENYSVFVVSSFQYIILAYVFSKSKPYRKWIISNVGLMLSLLVLTLFTGYISISAPPFLERILELFATPKDDMEFRWKLLGLVAANACAAILIEDGFVEIVLRNLWENYGFKKFLQYNEVENWMRSNPEWPTLTTPKIQIKDKVTSPSSKPFPFTVEVITEASGDIEKNFNFPAISSSNSKENAAIILNESVSSVR